MPCLITTWTTRARRAPAACPFLWRSKQHAECSWIQACSSAHARTGHAAVSYDTACSILPQEQVSSSYRQIGAAADAPLTVLPSSAGARDRRRAPAALTSRANSSLRPNLPAWPGQNVFTGRLTLDCNKQINRCRSSPVSTSFVTAAANRFGPARWMLKPVSSGAALAAWLNRPRAGPPLTCRNHAHQPVDESVKRDMNYKML